jgi:hypothetical protein
MNRKRKYEDEYRLISDLTGFDNLRAMIEAEKSRKKRKNKNKTTHYILLLNLYILYLYLCFIL